MVYYGKEHEDEKQEKKKKKTWQKTEAPQMATDPPEMAWGEVPRVT